MMSVDRFGGWKAKSCNTMVGGELGNDICTSKLKESEREGFVQL